MVSAKRILWLLFKRSNVYSLPFYASKTFAWKKMLLNVSYLHFFYCFKVLFWFFLPQCTLSCLITITNRSGYINHYLIFFTRPSFLLMWSLFCCNKCWIWRQSNWVPCHQSSNNRSFSSNRLFGVIRCSPHKKEGLMNSSDSNNLLYTSICCRLDSEY